MTNHEKQMMEQGLAGFRDTLPRLWWAAYSGAMAAGFTEPQAFTITLVMIQATQTQSGINAVEAPPSPPKGDE